MTSPDRSGTVLGRYRLVQLLGRGGMGEVYEAVDTDKDRSVALKLLPTALADDDAFRTRFLRESQTVARLNDPHIIPIHDFGELDGQLFLDMRIVRGHDLRSVIKAGPLPPERAVVIVEQVAAALDTAHASGLLHRDVKPENVLLDDRDFAYLADFGLAQSAGQTRLTSTGMAIGSFAYMAPERFGTDVPAGPSSDVYALTCVLYECLTGAQPFAATSIEQIIAGHLSRPVPATETVFDGVIAVGMAKDPAARFPSAGALAAAARDALHGRSPAAHTPTMVAPVRPAGQQTAQAAAAPTYPPLPVAEPAKASRSKTPLIAAAVTAAILLAAGGIGWGVLKNSGGSSPAAETSQAAPAPVTVTQTQAAPTTETTTQASPTQTPATRTTATRTTPAQRGSGDLGLSTPISTPACDGSTIAIVYSATSPGSYASEIQSALAEHPGAQYLRTDQSCASLRQSLNGNPIYAVYYPGSSLADSCAVKARTSSRVNVRRLDDSTPVNTELC
ncbi:serine/threonine-protein kinase [Gordonia phthalatica]|uniref:non-specific serine/threonine protein kinase n=1 Tax=Gordonia phthalatica TaxID=1136941 RepID=A0A0N9NEI3_9ACTN|nr:serine/threonine-protein kinase [Gordonia phthalatica]ALG83993.1 serine/threonine protein kinase [Gordonia phthalatica]